jgi:hypothetical protein
MATSKQIIKTSATEQDTGSDKKTLVDESGGGVAEESSKERIRKWTVLLEECEDLTEGLRTHFKAGTITPEMLNSINSGTQNGQELFSLSKALEADMSLPEEPRKDYGTKGRRVCEEVSKECTRAATFLAERGTHA